MAKWVFQVNWMVSFVVLKLPRLPLTSFLAPMSITTSSTTAGANLTRLSALSTNQSSAKIGKLVLERHKLLDLAWLDFIGHTRPQTPKGLPLEDAKQKAAPLAEQIRELAQPREIALELRARP